MFAGDGCSYADSWSSVAFQRMPNVSIKPGAKDIGWNDLIAATDRGIAILGRWHHGNRLSPARQGPRR